MIDRLTQLKSGAVWKICAECHDVERATREEVATIRKSVDGLGCGDLTPYEDGVVMSDCGGPPYLVLSPAGFTAEKVSRAFHHGDDRVWVFLEPVFDE